MAKEKLFHVGVKALITNEKNQILILDVNGELYGNKDAQWDIPGGRIQEGHTLEETLRREIEEEIGITKISKPEFYTAVISNHEIPLDGYKLGLIIMVFKVKIPLNSKIVLNEENLGYKWASRKEAAKYLEHKYPIEFTSLLK